MNQELILFYSKNEVKQLIFLIFSSLFDFSKADLILKKHVGLSESELLQIRAVIKKLRQREPIQYILGETYFCDLLLKTDQRALIPRPETEELVHFALQHNKSALRWMDLCTGSGCIALAVKNKLRSAHVEGIDAFQSALDLAQENNEKLNLNVVFKQFDLFSTNFENYLTKQEKWDVFLSNPPYIPQSDKSKMNENVLNYEPHEALFVSNDLPFLFYEKIAFLAKNHLVKSGKILVEIHEEYAENIVRLLQENQFSNVQVIKDLQGKNRMIYAENH